MKASFSRRWHNRLSIVFILPLFLVGMTAIFLAHGRALGLRQIMVPGMTLEREAELRSALPVDGGWLLGSRAGLFRYDGERLEAVPGLEGVEVRRLLQTPQGRFIASRQGIYRETDGQWRQVSTEDSWDLLIQVDGSLLALQAKSLRVSSDQGLSWRTPSQAERLPALLHNTSSHLPMTLGAFILGIHTGEIFLGEAEWLWIDSIGGLMVFLSLTGIWMWWRGRQRRLALA